MDTTAQTDPGALLRDTVSTAARSENLVPLLVDGLIMATVGVCSFGILLPPLLHGYTAMCLRIARGERAAVGDSFQGLQRFGGALVLGLLCLAVVALLTVVPVVGNFVGLCLCWWAFCVHVDRPGASALDALEASVDIARRHLGLTVIVCAVGAGLNAVLAFTVLGIAASVAFTGLLTALAYRRLGA